MLRLTLYGSFSVASATGAEIALKSRKARAMLSFLALSPGNSRSREEIMALLWSDRGEAQARASLRQVLTGLRKDLGEDFMAALRITDDAVSLDPDRVVVEDANGGEELLAGFHLHDPAFEDWLRDERLRQEEETTPGGQTAPLALPDRPSIAVLPFVNLSDDPAQEYFSDGITEDILTELSRFRSLFVIARNSSFHYKGQSPKVQEIGAELGVRYVVEGSVRKAGNRVRIAAQLIDAATGNHIWADRYDRELDDIFAMQDEVTGMIVSSLAGHLEKADRGRAARKSSQDLVAYDYLLLGDQSLHQGSKDDILRARQMFRRAIDLEPDSARAHSGLARSYLEELWSDWTTVPEQAAEQAFALAKRAVALDELDGRARTNLAAAHYLAESNFDLAEVQFDIALELNPNDADGYCLKGWCSVLAGRTEQAMVCTETAIRLNPFDDYDCREAQFTAAYIARHYQEAVKALASISNPGCEVNALLAACYAQQGREAEAQQAMASFMERAPQEIGNCPGDDPAAWRTYWARLFPFKENSHLGHLLDGFRKAGLPV
jgi:TolB-like protein/cytochrome c-type biogenesis protein CcmH/NrfG